MNAEGWPLKSLCTDSALASSNVYRASLFIFTAMTLRRKQCFGLTRDSINKKNLS